MRVSFVQAGVPNYTSFKPCTASSMNFLVAGMLPNTAYVMNSEVYDGISIQSGPDVTFRHWHADRHVSCGYAARPAHAIGQFEAASSANLKPKHRELSLGTQPSRAAGLVLS